MSSRIMKLEDCVALIIDCRGKTPQKLGSNWVDKGIRVISANNIHDGVLTDENEIRCVDDITCDKWMKEFVQRGDCFLVSEGATLGESLYWDSDEKVVLGQRLYAIRTKKDILDSKYFSLYLRTNVCRKSISAISTGSTVFGISQKDLLKLEIVVPDIFIQRKIGQLKYELDKKIQNNNYISVELESMAKTIYDYWFLQFDFPDENGKPYKSSGGKMVWNEELKREIPEGWEVKLLKDIEANIVTGKTPSTKDKTNYNGDIPFITIGDIRGNMHIVKTEQTLSQRGADSQSGKYIPSGSICVTCIASPGLVAFSTKTSQTNQQINSIVCDKDYNKLYLYFSIIDYFKYSSGAKTGNTFANMNKEDFSKIKLIYPTIEILEEYDKRTKDIYEMILIQSKENQELTTLRDFLLPLLMNGQVSFR